MTAKITPFGTAIPSSDEGVHHEVERPVAVLSSFTVAAQDQAGCANLWSGIARQAATWPGCRSFDIMLDRNDEMYCVVLSQWDSLEAYNDFARDSRLGWVMQTMRQMSVPGEYRFLDVACGGQHDSADTEGD